LLRFSYDKRRKRDGNNFLGLNVVGLWSKYASGMSKELLGATVAVMHDVDEGGIWPCVEGDAAQAKEIEC